VNNTNEQAIVAMIDWMRAEFLVEDKRERFCGELAKVLRREFEKVGWVRLYIDYDPNEPLLEALRAAGVECRGCMYSADGLFRGRKTGVTWRPEQQRVTVKLGYGGVEHELWPNRAPEAHR
jgi:hypothetical protein